MAGRRRPSPTGPFFARGFAGGNCSTTVGGTGPPRRDASNETQALRCKGETQTHLRVGTAVTTEHSRNELTRRWGITSGQLSHLMNGKRSPSPMLRGRLQEKLGGRDFGQLFTIEWMDGQEEDTRAWLANAGRDESSRDHGPSRDSLRWLPRETDPCSEGNDTGRGQRGIT